MKQQRAAGTRSHRSQTCLRAPEVLGAAAVHGAVTLHPWLETSGTCARTANILGNTTGMPTVEWSALGSASLSERAFGKRLDGTGIPAYLPCRPKEPPT